MRVNSGYLSGDAARIHFGIPENATIEISRITCQMEQNTTLDNLERNMLMTITRKGEL